MNILRSLFLLCVAQVLLTLSINANAQTPGCDAPFAIDIPGPGTVQLDPNAPVGTVLWSRSYHVTPYGGRGCSVGYAQVAFRGTATRGDYQTFSTRIKGLGYRLRAPQDPCVSGYWDQECSRDFGNVVPAHQLDLELVKTGPFTQSGEVLPEYIGFWLHRNAGGARSLIAKVNLRGSFVVTPAAPPTCSFSEAGSVQAKLGNVPAKSFNGIGSTSTSRSFRIDIACSGGDPGGKVEAHITLTDAANAANRTNVLTLSPDSQAKGIGIEVLHDGVVLGYGPDSNAPGNVNQWHAGTVSTGTGTFSIPLAARYVQTEPVVAAGTANARVTFTMSYQ